MAGPQDLPARYGGEEFIVLLPGRGRDEAVGTADVVRTRFAALGIPHEKNTAGPCATLSLGVSCVVPVEGFPRQKLIETADKALYVAKGERGRNHTVFLAPE
jgi:two-component system chemotaxis family response regulator WspR